NQQIDVVDEGVIANCVIGDVIVNLININVVSDGAVMQTTIVDAGVFFESSGKIECFIKRTQFDFTREMNIGDIIRGEMLSYSNSFPVFGSTSVNGQCSNFFFGKLTVMGHCN